MQKVYHYSISLRREIDFCNGLAKDLVPEIAILVMNLMVWGDGY